jgi:hypothetical protein
MTEDILALCPFCYRMGVTNDSTSEGIIKVFICPYFDLPNIAMARTFPSPGRNSTERLSMAGCIINSDSILNGNLPPRVFGLVAEWAMQHHDELRENWKLIQAETPPNKIDPLE